MSGEKLETVETLEQVTTTEVAETTEKNTKKEKNKKAKEPRVKREKKVKPKRERKPKKERAPKTERAAKKTKDGKKVRAPREKREKLEIPFYRGIAAKMIVCFLVPVVGVAVLGAVSYQKSSDAIVNTYKESVQQTTDMMEQYISLVATSEKDEFKSYLTEQDLKKYFGGLMERGVENTTRRDYQSRLRNKLSIDDKLHSIYFLADSERSIDSGTGKLGNNLYTDYKNTTQGAEVTATSTGWFVYGPDLESDDVIGMRTHNYSLRIVKRVNSQDAVMIINLSAEYVRSAMQALDPGKGGYVALVCMDGNEFFSDNTIELDEPLIYGTDFYQRAMDSKEETGNEMVTLNGESYMFVYSKLSFGNVLITALIPSARLLEQSSGIKGLTTVLTIICAILALALGFLLSRSMSGTIQYILRQLRKVSKGDLTVHLQAKSKDEFKLLCEGINDMVDHVKSLIRDVNAVSEEVGAAAVHVAQTSGTFMATSQDIQNAVLEIESGVNKLDTGSDNCLNQMDSLSGKINNVSSNADEIGKLTNAAGETINVGIASVQSLTESSESTAEITRNVIVSIEELQEKSKAISHIVSAINDIAEQTNLLSLNASIEAARAGDAGRGFSVVAEEIRKLADQCLASAGQISSIVKEILAKTGEVVTIARQAETVVSSQTGAVEDTTASFRQIDELVAQLITALQTITNNVQEMNGARNETLSAIESISDASTQTAACSSSVHSAAGTQLDAVKNLDEASQSLTAKAESLLDALSTFQV